MLGFACDQMSSSRRSDVSISLHSVRFLSRTATDWTGSPGLDLGVQGFDSAKELKKRAKARLRWGRMAGRSAPSDFSKWDAVRFTVSVKFNSANGGSGN
jgi:hypothetical protein